MDSAIADSNTYVFLFYVSGSLLLHVYKYTMCACYPQRSNEGIQSVGTRVLDVVNHRVGA